MAHEKTVRALLDRHGRTFSDEAGVTLADTPSPLFCWLVAALLSSARIGAAQAMEASRALIDAGHTTSAKMAAATWQQRVDVLTAHGYKRYDESASRMLGETAAMVEERYGGDLRRLRETAERDPGKERKLLKEFKGIGADVATRSAEKLKLPKTARGLAGLVPRRDYVRLLSALVRAELAGDHDDIRRSD